MSSSRTLTAGTLGTVLLMLPARDGGAGPGSQQSPEPSPSTSAPGPPAEEVTHLPRRLTQAVERLGDLPTAFPDSLDAMPEARFGPKTTGVRLSYRPLESLDDGEGWSSETVGLWLRDGTWVRLPLGSLGMADDLWPGRDMLGAGALNDRGTRLAFRASSGVVVIDLASGRWRHYLPDDGPVGLIRWHPGGSRFTADVLGRDLVVDVSTGMVSPAPVPARGLGFLSTGAAISVVRTDQRDVVAEHGPQSAAPSEIASAPASPLMTGDRFMSWVSGGRLGYYNAETVRGRYALRVVRLSTGQPVATLTWSRRTGTFFAMQGWWDEDTILLSMDRSLATWAPGSGEIVRIASLPPSDMRLAHGAVGISFPQTVG